MNVSVLLHVALLMESFPTVRARKRTRVRVNEQVSRECRAAFEHLLANVAHEILKRLIQKKKVSPPAAGLRSDSNTA